MGHNNDIRLNRYFWTTIRGDLHPSFFRLCRYLYIKSIFICHCDILLAYILSLLRIPIARIALSSILYVGIGFGVLLYVVDAGTIFSIIIGVFSSILATVLSFFVHQIRAYKYGKKILLFSAIGLTIISIALFMSNQSNVD